jgi:hypothetical protein
VNQLYLKIETLFGKDKVAKAILLGILPMLLARTSNLASDMLDEVYSTRRVIVQ